MLLKLGNFYLDQMGREWCCITFSCSHGPIYQCVQTRDEDGALMDLNSTYNAGWFDPAGNERLNRCGDKHHSGVTLAPIEGEEDEEQREEGQDVQECAQTPEESSAV